jgi:hypothetical protein
MVLFSLKCILEAAFIFVNIGDQRLVFNLQRQKQLDFDKLAKT